MNDVSYPGPPGSPQYPQDPRQSQGGFGQVPPQGQPQGAFGQTPAPGGYPPPQGGGGYTQPPPGYGLPTPPKKKAPTARIIVGVVAAVVVIIVAVVALVQRQSAPDTAAVNDCMHADGDDANSLKKVDCNSDWNFKVVGKIDNVTESQWNAGSENPADPGGICHAYPSTTASFWKGEQGGKGYVLCLQDRDAGSGGASPAAGG